MTRTMRKARILGLLGLLAGGVHPGFAQLPNQDYRGIAETGLGLRKLANTERILVIGAHPDDEDNQLLSVLSLGEGADVGYLALTRGEGGQNSIGGELGPALGVLRTEELLAARGLDRAEQFFTRAYDFGFSKNAEETLRHWPRDSILSDVVATVRRYRPDIIIAIFSGTPRDGHGQHQVSGQLAREAFDAAADPARFPAQIRAGMRPHRALKLFQATGYRQADPTQRFATGQLDPLFGRSYAQIAAASRSRHRSQDEGQLQTFGPRNTSVRLLRSLVDVRGDSTLFAHMDTTLVMKAVAAHENANVLRSLQRYDSLIATAHATLPAYTTAPAATLLAQAVRELATAAPGIGSADVRFNAEEELADASRWLVQAAGVVVDAVMDTEVLVGGNAYSVDLALWNAGDAPVRVRDFAPVLPPGWSAVRTDSTTNDVVQPGMMLTRRFKVAVPADATISQP
ncbi:MAG TPA: PIG-L family deacetylase, partial [Longimicrobiales bacterium]